MTKTQRQHRGGTRGDVPTWNQLPTAAAVSVAAVLLLWLVLAFVWSTA